VLFGGPADGTAVEYDYLIGLAATTSRVGRPIRV
jgi:hypothetical protein